MQVIVKVLTLIMIGASFISSAADISDVAPKNYPNYITGGLKTDPANKADLTNAINQLSSDIAGIINNNVIHPTNANLNAAGAAIQQNHTGLTAANTEIETVKGRLDGQQQFDQLTGVTLEANRQQLATHQAGIATANTHLAAAGAAIQQNHTGLTAANTEIETVKGRLDGQQQFDQLTGVTLEANRQQLATHQAGIATANTHLAAAGAAIQQNHTGLTAANTEIETVKGRLDGQQQFDQLTGVTLEANRQQLATHQAGIATANTHLAAAGAAIQQNHTGLTAANTEIETVKGRLDGQQQFDQLTGVTLEANRQQLATHQAGIETANTHLAAAGAAIQQNHTGLTAANTEIETVKGRLDGQQQFDQLTGVTLEANRQQLATHQAGIETANTHLAAAGAAIQQNHTGLTAANTEIETVKGRLDGQQQFDQLTGVTLEANRQQLATHQAGIATANTNLAAAGAAIQQNHTGLTAANTEIETVKGRLDGQQQFDQLTGVTLEANRQQLATHQAGIATANTNLAAAGAAIQQNHTGLTAANTEIETVKGRLDGQQQFDQLTGVTLEANRRKLDELNARVSSSDSNIDYLQEWQGMANTRINDLERVTAENRKVSSRGIAGVAAMANIPTPMDGGFALGIGYGYYDNQNAFAVGASKYFESGVAIKGGVSLTGKHAVVGAGASYSFK